METSGVYSCRTTSGEEYSAFVQVLGELAIRSHFFLRCYVCILNTVFKFSSKVIALQYPANIQRQIQLCKSFLVTLIECVIPYKLQVMSSSLQPLTTSPVIIKSVLILKSRQVLPITPSLSRATLEADWTPTITAIFSLSGSFEGVQSSPALFLLLCQIQGLKMAQLSLLSNVRTH